MSNDDEDGPFFEVIEGGGERSRKKIKLPPPGSVPKAWIVTFVVGGDSFCTVFRKELIAQKFYKTLKERSGLTVYITQGLFDFQDEEENTRMELIVAILKLWASDNTLSAQVDARSYTHASCGFEDAQSYVEEVLKMDLEQLRKVYEHISGV
jgi:ADP-ribose pyrophosphatase YjhB (NUDIX family)